MAVIRVAQAARHEMPLVQAIGQTVYSETFAPYNTTENMRAYLKEAYNLDQLMHEWAEAESAYLIAWSGELPAGFLRLRRNDEVAAQLGNDTLELQRLYVYNSFQGRGVAARLMEEFMDIAQARQVEWVWLGVWEKNFRAQAFYQKWGFRKFGEHVFQMGDDPQIDWLFCRKLS